MNYAAFLYKLILNSFLVLDYSLLCLPGHAHQNKLVGCIHKISAYIVWSWGTVWSVGIFCSYPGVKSSYDQLEMTSKT